MEKHLKWYLLIVLALIWGSSFILIKKGLIGLNPFQLGSLRILFCSVFLLIIGFKSLTKIPKNQWRYIILTALFGTFLPVYLFSVAQTEISSSISAILNSLTPLYTLLIGAIVFGLNFQRRQFFGITIGLIGCILLIYNGAINNPDQNYYYTLLVVIASICYATNVNLIKKHLSNLSPLAISTGNFTIMLFPALIILFFSGFFDIVTLSKTQESIMYIAILGILGTAVANIIFFKMIQIASPIFASSVTYLIPLVAFCWGLLDNESLSIIQLFGAFIVLIGVYFSARK